MNEMHAVLGGNAITIHTKLPNGEPYAVDPVAYLFVKPRYPFFTTWIEQLGVKTLDFTFDNYFFDSYHRNRGVLFTTDKKKILSSPSLTYFKDLYSFKQIIKTADKFYKMGMLPDEILLKDFVAQVDGLRDGFLEEVFYPLMSFAYHCSPQDIRNQPCGTTMRSYVAGASDPKAAYCFHNGIKSYVDVVEKLLKNTNICLNSHIVALEKTADTWTVKLANGNCDEYDEIILAIWPHQAAAMLDAGQNNGNENKFIKQTVEIYNNVESAHCLATIHNDSSTMPSKKKNWATYSYHANPKFKNVLGTIWSGQAENKEVFTTYDWNTSEDAVKDLANQTPVSGPIHAQNYHVRTPPRAALYRMQEHLNTHQGNLGLWFTGCFMRGTGFHEDGFVATIGMLEKMHPSKIGLDRMNTLIDAIEKKKLKKHV